MEETEEQRLDREFDELNEGLMAWQICEWFEKRRPEPTIPEDEVHRPDSLAWAIWDQWQKELVYYADGWKDALKALQERQILERCMEEEPKWFNFFEYIWSRPEEYFESPRWMTIGESRRYQWIIDLVLIKREEWDEPRG